ncbi:MAG: hypothetical protein P8Y80_09050 [Acidobacteriota bacterium]|jgi:hypothetical protein
MADQAHFQTKRNFPGKPVGCTPPRRRRLKFGRVFIAYLLTAFSLFAGMTGMSRAEVQSAGKGFLVKHVYSGVVYIDAGSSVGLKEGQTLSIKRIPSGMDLEAAEPIGQVEIESVVAASAAGKIVFAKSDILPGDIAYIEKEPVSQSAKLRPSLQDRETVKTAALSGTGTATQKTNNTSARPGPRKDNLVRGRIGIDYGTLRISGSEASSSQFGFLLRIDASRIGGSHWNISGYQRGRFQSRTNSQGQETLNDLINRTYRLNISYENPDSNWVFGAGRLYVPWASSLDTLDGFYLGRKLGMQTAGVFMGTAPDPTSWNYSPDRRMGGAFYNIKGGSFESFRFDSTSGIGLSWLQWRPERKFGFFENNFFYKRYVSIYSNIEADLLTGAQNNGSSEVVLSRSYFTVRLQPHKMVSFNMSHNYFKNIPTFDTRLIGTGLVDKFLFQGISVGFRLSLPHGLGLYANAGRSSRTGDSSASWNYLAGASASDILDSGVRLGFRFSRFDGSFGRGTYQSLSLSREIGEYFQFEVQGGQQDFKSLYTSQDRARFVNGTVDWLIGSRYFLGGGVTVYRRKVQDYNQYFFRLGYRFDNRRRSNNPL